MGRDSLKGIAARVPGSKVLGGEFHAAGVAAAVPKNHPAALAYLRAAKGGEMDDTARLRAVVDWLLVLV